MPVNKEKKYISVKDTTIPFQEFVKMFSTEYMTYRDLLSCEGDNGLMRAA